MLLAFAGAVGFLVRDNSARAQSAKSRIIDRTVMCSISPGNPREIDVSATSGTRLFGDRSQWRVRPSFGFHDARSQTLTGPLMHAGIVAGWPPERPANPDSFGYSVRCRSTRATLRLSTAGLSGGPASPNGDEYDCRVPANILVRLRAVYREPTSLRRKKTRFSDQFVARGAVQEASFVIATLSRKRIAFATAHESGRARLFVGDTCGPSG